MSFRFFSAGAKKVINIWIPASAGMTSNSVCSDFLKGHFTDMVIEADLKLIKNTFAAEEIKADSKTLGKTDWGRSCQ